MAAMVGEMARDFTLPDADARARTLHEFHRLGPVALLFVPSVFGMRPRFQFWSLLRHYDRFVESGTEVVVVTSDPLPELRIFQIQREFPFVFLADRGARVASEYQLAPGMAATLVINTHGVIRFRRAARLGWRSSARGMLRWIARLRREERFPVS